MKNKTTKQVLDEISNKLRLIRLGEAKITPGEYKRDGDLVTITSSKVVYADTGKVVKYFDGR